MGATIKTSLSDCHMRNTRMKDDAGEKVRSSANTGGLGLNRQPGFDRVTISSFGINMSKGNVPANKISIQIKTLMEQKENLLEQKNKVMASTLEQGRSPKTIEEAIEETDKMLEELDKQIAKVRLDEQKKSMGLDEESRKGKPDSASSDTDNDSQDSKGGLASNTINTFISAGNDLNQIKNIGAAKANAEGRSRVLKTEIELDESRSSNGRASKNKYKERDELEQSISALTEDIAKRSSDANEKLSENADKEDIKKTVDGNAHEAKVKEDTKSDNSIRSNASGNAGAEKSASENNHALGAPVGKSGSNKN